MGLTEYFDALITREKEKDNEPGAYALGLQARAVAKTMRHHRIDDLSPVEIEGLLRAGDPRILTWSDSPITVHTGTRSITYENCGTREFTATEFRLFERLASPPLTFVSCLELQETLFGEVSRQAYGSLKVQALRLRAKVEPEPHQPRHLLSRKYLGYMFDPVGRVEQR